MFRLVIFASLFAYASAQSLSSGCLNTLTIIGENENAKQCLNFTPTDISFVQPLKSMLESICNAPLCTDDTIKGIVTNLTTGCSTDFHLPENTISLIPQIQTIYNVSRKSVCLEHNGSLCLLETLAGVESAIGPFTIDSITKFFESPPLLPATVVCSDCNKAMLNIWTTAVPSLVEPLKPALQTQCGESFFNGSAPPDITQLGA